MAKKETTVKAAAKKPAATKKTTAQKTTARKCATKKPAALKVVDQKEPEHIGLVRNDGWLEPFEAAIRGRHDHAVWKINSDVASGQQYETYPVGGSGTYYFGAIIGGGYYSEYKTDRTVVIGGRSDVNSEYVHRTPDKMNDGFTYRGLQIDLFCMYPSLLPWLHRIAYLIYRYTVSRMVGHSYHLAKISFYIQRYFVHPIFYAFSSVFGKKNVYMHAYGTPFRFRFPRETVLPYKDIIFENHRFPGPCDPDNYCICHYGSNYRDLPEEDQRNHHDVDYILND